jgi:Na+-translocating ferredoxin:NAD+ oxidoreductase subunit D
MIEGLTPAAGTPAAALSPKSPRRWQSAPALRAPEGSRTVFRVLVVAALAPLVMGLIFFGFRAGMVAALAVGGCLVFNWACFRVMGTPAMNSRTHAVLTGLLLALTLGPQVPWYVPVVGAAFATLVGKAVFGGVGHFLWQPALVGRLAVAVMFSSAAQPALWPLLSPAHVLTGDVRTAKAPAGYTGWSVAAPLEEGADGYLLRHPADMLRGLYDEHHPPYTSIQQALLEQPPIRDLLYGSSVGGIGETSAVVLLLVGVYLMYRHYVPWPLPVAMILSAAAVVAVAPVQLAGPAGQVRSVWWPLFAEGWPVGFTFVNYHLAAGELLLAAILLAPEMTSRPVTPYGQVFFGAGCGGLAMLLRLYVIFPLDAYIAVLVMNTFTPVLELLTRPRVLGRKPWWQWRWERRGS